MSGHSLRIFFAIDFDEKTLEALSSLCHQLQLHYHAYPIRWCKAKQLHITLQFLPAVDPLHLNTLIKNARDTLKSFPAFELKLGKIELFPTPHHPRIISMTMNQPLLLADLSSRLGDAILKSGYEVEIRPFRGHLTLGRLTQPLHQDFELIQVPQPFYQKIQVTQVVLYQSELSREGSHYHPLGSISLRP